MKRTLRKIWRATKHLFKPAKFWVRLKWDFEHARFSTFAEKYDTYLYGDAEELYMKACKKLGYEVDP